MVSKLVYQYDELSDRAKECAREWYLQGVFDYGWWDNGYEYAKRMLAFAGFTIASIEYDVGFNVSFEAKWYADAVDAKKLRDEAPTDTCLHEIADVAVSIRNDFELARDDEVCTYPSARIHSNNHGYMAVDVFDCEDDVEEKINDIVKLAAWWVGKQLRAEEEHMTSEEVVAENIRYNEYEFEENGRRA
jgi:hypothetical protein